MHDHKPFWLDLAGRVGAPLFAGSIVGAIITQSFSVLNIALIVSGLALIALDHAWTFHGFHHRRSS